MRLRTLSEAECYARCYGGRGEERVSFVQTVSVRRRDREERSEPRLDLFDLDLDGPEPEREAA